MSNLMTAAAQWATRPEDQCFADIYELQAYLAHRQELTREVIRPVADLRATVVGEDVRLLGQRGDAQMTHWSFNQVAGIAGLSGEVLRKAQAKFLSKERAAQWISDGLNQGLEAKIHELKQEGNSSSDKLNLLFQMPNGSPLTLRAATTDKYSRIWDLKVVNELLVPLVRDHGFHNPPSFKKTHKGLYASDRDMFAFLCPRNTARLGMPTLDGGVEPFDIGGQTFFPFIITTQTEVGGASARFMGGLLQQVCGNHIIWGARDVVTFDIRHVGNAWDKMSSRFLDFVREWVSAGTLAERQMLQAAIEHHVAKSQEGATDWLRGKGYSKKASEEAVKTVLEGDKSTGVVDSDPTRLFNLVSALTAANRLITQQDARLEADVRASRLLAVAGKN